MCGGDNSAQKNAASSQGKLSDTMAGIFNQNQKQVNPFWQKQMNEGLPFMKDLTDYSGGAVARSFAPARAQLSSRLSRMGTLPSGFATSARTRLDSDQARTFDSNMVQNLLLNQQAKQQGAQALNPLGFGTAAQQGYGSVMQMPVQPSALGSIFGGAMGGLLAAA